ncbi:hypothetical protein VTN31DRAFT_5841 [Thermomyces dupontii]|uniref:uncharacterized protein n=1 Tax=Talaromyces thermophilus TaxID=28565 RepID=UPI0037439C9B
MTEEVSPSSRDRRNCVLEETCPYSPQRTPTAAPRCRFSIRRAKGTYPAGSYTRPGGSSGRCNRREDSCLPCPMSHILLLHSLSVTQRPR